MPRKFANHIYFCHFCHFCLELPTGQVNCDNLIGAEKFDGRLPSTPKLAYKHLKR